MILESILYDLSARFHVQSVYLRIYVVYQIKILSAFFIKYQFHLILVFYISGVHHRSLEPKASYHFRIVDSRISFTVVYASCYEYQIRVDLLYPGQIASSQPSHGNIVNNSSSSKSSFFGCLCRHIIYKTVYSHFKTAGGGRSCQHLIIFQLIYVHFTAEVVYGPLKTNSNVSVHNGSRSLTLRPENGIIAVQVFKCVYHRSSGTYFRN